MNAEKQVLLVYGSEFGTAYDCSRNIFYELYKSINVDFFSLNEVMVHDFLFYKHVIIIVSTTGYGACTHNMSKFWLSIFYNSIKCISRNLMFDDTIQFHIFGLGDKSYENYNATAKKLKEKLKSMEANIVNYSLGDYQHNSMHFTNFVPWKKRLYDLLKKQYGSFICNKESPSIYKVILCQNKNRTNKTNLNSCHSVSTNTFQDFDIDDHFCNTMQFNKMEIIKNQRCTSETYEKDTRRIDLKTKSQFNTCGLVHIHPFLNVEKTKHVLKLLRINYEEYIILEDNYKNISKSSFLPLNKKIKIIDLFVHFLDLNKIVSPFFFRYLSERTLSEMHKKKFEQFANETDISEYFSYIVQDKRSYYDIFYDFYKYIDVDITFLINTMPYIQPRIFSILNTPYTVDWFVLSYGLFKYHILKSYPTYTQFYQMLKRRTNSEKIELLVCLYEYERNAKVKLKGLCSEYLINSEVGSFVYSKTENGLLYMNKKLLSLNYRVVYISTGGATSSIMSLVRYRHYLHQMGIEQKQLSTNQNNHEKDIMFLGFRNKEQDFYFKEELALYLYFNLVYVAFSRDADNFFCYNEEEEDSHEEEGKVTNCFDMKEKNDNVERNFEMGCNQHYEIKELCKKKKRMYVTDIIKIFQEEMYQLLKKENTMIVVAGKSKPFSQNLIKLFADIIKSFEPDKSEEVIKLFLKRKIDEFSIILESWY